MHISSCERKGYEDRIYFGCVMCDFCHGQFDVRSLQVVDKAEESESTMFVCYKLLTRQRNRKARINGGNEIRSM